MKRFPIACGGQRAAIASILAVLTVGEGQIRAQAPAPDSAAASSPWGESDEIGTLNMMTDASRGSVLRQISGGRIYDLGVELFVGMPFFGDDFGDPNFQIWMTHAPLRARGGESTSHSGDAVIMSTHAGTHIDALNHFGLHGKIWNQVDASEALGVRGWTRSGADKIPPIVARGVLIDVAKAKKLDRLPPSYAITAADLQEALANQQTKLRPGDVVLVRTGLMTLWPDASRYQLMDQSGLGLDAARWLVEEQRVMVVGADNFGVESFPPKDQENFAPVHTYLLAERGVPLIEVIWLEDLARDQVYEFLFIASPIKLRGATGSPIRPIAIRLQKSA